MSGIYIKGMEMPKDREINLRIDAKGEVYVYGSYPTELHKAVSVVVERKKGEWLDTWHELWKTELPVCSYCGSFAISHFNYCPTCGADMRPTQFL